MPISPKNRALYPANWRAISDRVKRRAGWRCQCTGECGKLHGATHERCAEYDRKAAVTFKGKVTLTVAHLNHTPSDVRDVNLLALCQACHLALDHDHHQANAARTREARKLRA